MDEREGETNTTTFLVFFLFFLKKKTNKQSNSTIVSWKSVLWQEKERYAYFRPLKQKDIAFLEIAKVLATQHVKWLDIFSIVINTLPEFERIIIQVVECLYIKCIYAVMTMAILR